MIETVTGLECLGKGDWQNGNGSRLVYAVDDKTVIKIGHANVTEYNAWIQLQDSWVAPYLFPCIDLQVNNWLLMERALYVPKAAVAGWGFHKKEDEEATRFLARVAEHIQVWDWKPQNIGIKQDGSWAILDYGFIEPRVALRKGPLRV